MSHDDATPAVLGENAWLDLAELARASGENPEFVVLLVEEGLVSPVHAEPGWLFGGEELAQVRRIARLRRDFDASLSSLALMLDLLDEVQRLRALLRRSGAGGP